jgi:hypothetical protein
MTGLLFCATNQRHSYDNATNKHRFLQSPAPVLLARQATASAILQVAPHAPATHPACPPTVSVSDHQSSKCEQPHSPSHDEFQAPSTVQSQRKRAREPRQAHEGEEEHLYWDGGRPTQRRVTQTSTVTQYYATSPSDDWIDSEYEETGFDSFNGPFVQVDYRCGPFDWEE